MTTQTARMSRSSSGAPENPSFLPETSAEGRNKSSSRGNVPVLHAGRSPEITTTLTDHGSSSSLGSFPQSPDSSRSEGRITVPQTESGVSPDFLERTRELPEEGTVHTQVVGTGVSSQASLPALEPGKPTVLFQKRNSSGQEHSGLQFSWTQSRPPPSDHPSSFGGHQLASSSEAGNGSAVPLTELAFRSVPSIDGGEHTGQWFPTKSKTSTAPAENSALHPEAGSPRALTQFSHTAQQPQGGSSGLDGKSSSESSSTSSSESLDSAAPRGGHSTPEEDGALLSDSSDLAESTSVVRAPHTSAMLTRGGERTLRSLGLSRAAATHPARPTPRGNVTEHAGLLPRAATLGVTGLNDGQEPGSDAEQRTSGDHTDHAYVSSTFTKGERTLLSITENSSSSDSGESSTSYIRISDPPRLDFSSSQAQTKRSNVSSYDGEPAQSSTQSLDLHTSHLPSHTSTVNVPDTLGLDASTQSVEDPSEAAPSPLPSVLQPHQFPSTLPSTGSPTQQLKSTSEPATPSASSPPPSPISFVVSTFAPHSVPQTTVPHSSSPLIPHRAREPRVTSVQMSTVVSPVVVFPSNQTADPKNQNTPQQEKTVTEAKSPSLASLPTDSTKPVTMSLPPGTPWSPALMGFSTEPALPATSTSLAQMSPASSPISQTTHSPVTSPSTVSSTEALTPGAVIVPTTPEEQHLPTNPEILVLQTSTEQAVTTEGTQVHMDPTTHSASLTTAPTSAEVTTELGQAEEASPVSPFLRTSSPQATDVSTAAMLTSEYTTFAAQSPTRSPTALSPPAPVNSCTVNPCLHDGECLVDLTGRGYRCVCPPAWQGDNCSVDVNECLSSPCPPLATCNNTQGSFSCRCPVGYQLEKGICNLVRTFVTEFKLKKTFLNTTVDNHSSTHEVENEITHTLNLCFSSLPGYIRSTVAVSREPSTEVISLQSTFALASNVTLFDLADGIQKYVNSCRSSAEVCQLLGSQRRIFRAGNLCKRKSPECDRETSVCTDLDGIALCQCKSGYFQFNKMDHSCRACEDGYRLENETCMSCPFGLGGLNCGNPYQLITVVIAAAGGGLLLILGIALIVTCCRKSKNDISKLIFKSGDFQMSPYAEYPKNPRSQEWGREAIEMHENGSTKNLLQMTDVYYSPTNVRNPELERNGLYPAYTGLPGSRHSCIFPGQYNPSFISDESRRRDYF